MSLRPRLTRLLSLLCYISDQTAKNALEFTYLIPLSEVGQQSRRHSRIVLFSRWSFSSQFALENQSIANAIMGAIEKIVQESGGDVRIVPDYASLLGTLRACQQQTAAFRWALLYEATEQKIETALASPDSHSRKRRKTEDPVTTCRDSEEADEPDKSRALPFLYCMGCSCGYNRYRASPSTDSCICGVILGLVPLSYGVIIFLV